MNRKIIITLIFCLILLVGCGATDPVSQKVMDDINSIGEVSLDDGDLISKTIDLYSTLTDQQKKQVNNYTTLLDAKDKYDQLVKEAEAAQKAEIEALYNEEPYKHAIALMANLKSKLFNPSSFSLDYVIAYENDDAYYFDVCYIGENKVGGLTSDYVIGIIMKNDINDFVFLTPSDDLYSSNHLAMTTAGNSNFSDLEVIEKMDVKRILDGIEYMGY